MTTPAPPLSTELPSPPQIAAEVATLRAELGKVIVGQQSTVQAVLAGLMAQGHILLEGAPGLGKTLLVKTLAQCTDLSFSRIQFTPDLMPSDITGTTILELDAEQRAGGHQQRVQRGPIFAQLVLADEINRATPKTQSALLEAMGERSVTLGGQRQDLPAPFLVLATENPIEMEGTFPLPEAQLDRFLFKVILPTPSEQELCEVLLRTTSVEQATPHAVVSAEQVLVWGRACRSVYAAPELLHYAARLVHASDPSHPGAPAVVQRAVRYGAGVRAAQALVLAGKAIALQQGRGHVSHDDVAYVAPWVLRHRIVRSFEGEAEGVSHDALVEAIVAHVPRHSADVEAKLREAVA